METALQQFVSDDGSTIRVVERDGEVWFVAADVCAALDLGNPSQTSSRLDEDEKDGITTNDTVGRRQNLLCVNESGLYHLIFTSRKPEAEKFRRWVTGEVIPALRNGGMYVAKQLSSLDMADAMLQVMREQEQALSEHAQRLDDLELRQTAIEKGANYFTVVAFARRIGRRIDNTQAQSLGKYASRYSRKHDYPIGYASDARYGKVGTYHEEVLLAVFGVKDAAQ
jgi:prophage antirepressor-like protein